MTTCQIESKRWLDEAADVLLECRRRTEHEDQELNALARDYQQLMPGYVAVPLVWSRDDGYVPAAHGLAYLACRAGHDPEHEPYPWVMIHSPEGDEIAIVFAPELTGLYPPPTFSQYIQWRGLPAKRALRVSRRAADEFTSASRR